MGRRGETERFDILRWRGRGIRKSSERAGIVLSSHFVRDFTILTVLQKICLILDVSGYQNGNHLYKPFKHQSLRR